ncbi:MAG: ATP-binding protein [Sodaliphilus sp.]
MANYHLIGRENEIAELERLLRSDKSEFLAVYGRRRVGKSYLIQEVYGEQMAFSTVGVYFRKDKRPASSYRKEQLLHFYESLLQYGLPSETPPPTSWREAFRLLRMVIEADDRPRKVVFLDELPWLAGPQSAELIAELGFFWNSWACHRRNIILVVCGSATSWMLNNVIRDYGGLYSRLTLKMQLKPFSLGECEQYYMSRHFHLSRYEMALAYMALGGIPYYMDMLRNDETLSENINRIFFNNNAIKQEFEDVYVGLFQSLEKYLDIVMALGNHHYGMTRNEIAQSIGATTGGGLSTMLDNLEQSGIVSTYPRRGTARKETMYRLVDFFSLFYLKNVCHSQHPSPDWMKMQRSPRFFSWAGISFEILVAQHLQQLQDALRIANVTGCYCWNADPLDDTSAQIDLVIEWHGERTDYLCEIKFSENEFTITADYKQNLLNKVYAFMQSNQHIKSHSVMLVMVTTMGVKRNSYSECVNASITLDSLFG